MGPNGPASIPGSVKISLLLDPDRLWGPTQRHTQLLAGRGVFGP
jgi:hypothetical protein